MESISINGASSVSSSPSLSQHNDAPPPASPNQNASDTERRNSAPPVLLGDGCEKRNDAYNDLHGLAQEFHTPFDAPAILVVGHQTDGKSALVEALMGLQFNHVGGGTKTRRSITLHMKYNALWEEPQCHLVSEGDPTLSEEKSLDEIQAYIEPENMSLERDACQFYKYCPNLTIIDTPGLVAPAPGRQNRMLQAQAHAVEALVREKMQHKEFIILCLGNRSDWSNATTRWVVMQVLAGRHKVQFSSHQTFICLQLILNCQELLWSPQSSTLKFCNLHGLLMLKCF